MNSLLPILVVTAALLSIASSQTGSQCPNTSAMSLQSKVVAITGANGITGKVTARLLLDNGASVALISSNKSNLDELVKSFSPSEQSRIYVVAADLSQKDATQSAAKSISERFGGKLNCLVHLVGGWTGGKPLIDTDSSDLEKMINQHIWTTWNIAQAFVPLLKNSKNGRIVAVSHPAASVPVPNMIAYESAKAAQEAMLLGLNEEVKGDGVRVSVIQVAGIFDGAVKSSKPSKGSVSAQEIASMVKYLMEDSAHALHGTRIRLDGEI